MMDGTEGDEGIKKHSAGSKNSHPIGTKKAKQLKRAEEIAEHIGATLGIPVKKEHNENNMMHGDNNVTNDKASVGNTLNEIVNIARAGFASWEQSMYFQHADENLKQQLANARIRQEINCLNEVEEAKNKKKMIMHDEDDVIGAFMQLASESVDGDSDVL